MESSVVFVVDVEMVLAQRGAQGPALGLQGHEAEEATRGSCQ